MYVPQRPLFGRGPELTLSAVLYPREDGYVDLITVVAPRGEVTPLERCTYARLTLEEACDVWVSQAGVLMVEESPS